MTELEIVFRLQQLVIDSPILVSLVMFAARYLIVVFFVLAAFLYFSRTRHERHAVMEAAWAVLFAVLITSIIGAVIGRDRPFQATPFFDGFPVHLLIPDPLTSSFPSGHTSASVALAAAIFWGDKKLGCIAILAALVIGAGRVFAGVHYPSDIIAGVLVGLAGFALIRYIHKVLKLKKV